MTAVELREQVAAKYRTIIGRNLYSQAKRDCCFKKYSDGKYYSDCSSSVCYTYKECGLSFGILNTVGMYQSTKLKKVDAIIKNGIIQNPEVLRVGDMLLFAGNDSSRKYAGYVGHVEMVGKITEKAITIYGHGSGTPRATEMNAYCKKRYGTKASTALGNRGLIKVVRFIQDDEPQPEKPVGKQLKVKPGTWNIRSGPDTEYPVVIVAKGGAILDIVTEGEWFFIRTGNISGYISPNAVERV